MATGGAGIANAPDGRIIMVTGAVPGDQVEVEITREKKRLLEARVVKVVKPGQFRIAASCEHYRNGCGGCDWQFVEPAGATELRRQIVAESLRRLGKIESVEVVAQNQSEPSQPLPTKGYRTTVRAAVQDGRAGFRKSRSHELVMLAHCETAHPLVEEVLVEGRFPGAGEIVVKVGSRTGECLVVSDGPAASVARTVVPEGVQVISREQLRAGQEAWIHEEVSGHRFRISADSFFQARPDGAEALVKAVGDAVEGTAGPIIDAYSGVGLFGATVARDRDLTAIESNRSSVRDARVNLAESATIIQSRVERWKASKAEVVVADPARRGLAADGVATLSATGAEVLALVSCDPASLARDARLLIDEGFELDWVRTVDLFGQTSHVEAVSRFSR